MTMRISTKKMSKKNREGSKVLGKIKELALPLLPRRQAISLGYLVQLEILLSQPTLKRMPSFR
jgi:hypothetical protein